MPRITRRTKRKTEGYSEAQINQLLSGCEMINGLAFGSGDHFDEASARAAWDHVGESLVSRWIESKPLTRPWGWWRWNAPEKRQRIGGRCHPFDDKERARYVANSDNPCWWKRAYELSFGMPTCFIPQFDKDLYHDFWHHGLHGKESVIFERERDYLARLDLLTQQERKLYAKD